MKKTKGFVITISGLLLAVIGLYLIKTTVQPQGIMKVLPYLGVGLGCGMFGHGWGEIFSGRFAEKNPDEAKRIEIETEDERNVMIGNMAKAKGYDMMTYVFAALLLVYALMGASYTIIIPFIVAYLFIHGYAMYYRLKFEKEQ